MARTLASTSKKDTIVLKDPSGLLTTLLDSEFEAGKFLSKQVVADELWCIRCELEPRLGFISNAIIDPILIKHDVMKKYEERMK